MKTVEFLRFQMDQFVQLMCKLKLFLLIMLRAVLHAFQVLRTNMNSRRCAYTGCTETETLMDYY